MQRHTKGLQLAMHRFWQGNARCHPLLALFLKELPPALALLGVEVLRATDVVYANHRLSNGERCAIELCPVGENGRRMHCSFL
jgi:hypothetical protein